MACVMFFYGLVKAALIKRAIFKFHGAVFHWQDFSSPLSKTNE